MGCVVGLWAVGFVLLFRSPLNPFPVLLPCRYILLFAYSAVLVVVVPVLMNRCTMKREDKTALRE